MLKIFLTIIILSLVFTILFLYQGITLDERVISYQIRPEGAFKQKIFKSTDSSKLVKEAVLEYDNSGLAYITIFEKHPFKFSSNTLLSTTVSNQTMFVAEQKSNAMTSNRVFVQADTTLVYPASRPIPIHELTIQGKYKNYKIIVQESLIYMLEPEKYFHSWNIHNNVLVFKIDVSPLLSDKKLDIKISSKTKRYRL